MKNAKNNLRQLPIRVAKKVSVATDRYAKRQVVKGNEVRMDVSSYMDRVSKDSVPNPSLYMERMMDSYLREEMVSHMLLPCEDC
jgi:hypothetical protein